jgi:S1-C subfamily serine protease
VLTLAGSGLATALAGCSSSSSTPTAEPTGEGEESVGAADQADGSDSTDSTTPSPTPVDGADGVENDSAYTQVYRDTIDSVALIRNPNGSQGTGWVFEDGVVVTNAHVVGEADQVRVGFSEEETQVSEVLGRDDLSDLAAVRVEDTPDYADSLSLTDSEPVIGTSVAVIGTPYGLRGSLSSGVVSGRNRLIPNPRANFILPNAIQTDAPVNPGNSRGPLVNLDGTVLGVVNSGRGDNIAFAISPSMVRRVIPGLVADGNYEHPYLGARVGRVTAAVAEANELDSEGGLLVRTVDRGSPADGPLQEPTSATRVDGFRIPTGGDVIRAVDGTEVSTRQEYLSTLFLDTAPGETVEVDIVRDSGEQTVSVTLGTFPDR